MYHRLRGTGRSLKLLAEPAAVFKPCERALHDPASWQNLEAIGRIASPDNLEFNPSMSTDAGYPIDELAAIASVGPDLANPAVFAFKLF